MFEVEDAGGRVDASAPVPTSSDVVAFATLLAGGVDHLDDADRIDLIRGLEVLKCAAVGAQAVVTADFDASQRAQAAARGVPQTRQGRGIAHQVALARRVSPHQGQRATGLARILVDELPYTLAALRAGRITEWKAILVARETACLSLADRRRIDRELAGDPARIEQMGDSELGNRASKRAADSIPSPSPPARARPRPTGA